MEKLEALLTTYGESHQNTTNKAIHWVCVPAIMFSLVGMLMQIPFPVETSFLFNWASFILAAALLYYFWLSRTMALGFVLISFLLLWGNHNVAEFCHSKEINPVFFSLGIFIVAWIGQFIGHHIEGKKPSFLKDVQFLLIGPAWLLHFVFKKLNISY